MSLEGGKEHTKKKFDQIWKADVSMKDAGQNLHGWRQQPAPLSFVVFSLKIKVSAAAR